MAKKKCPTSWENRPTTYIVVTAVSITIATVLAAALTKYWGLSLQLQKKLELAQKVTV